MPRQYRPRQSRASHRTPLGGVRAQLRAGVDVRTALRPVLGEDFTAYLVRIWTHAHITNGSWGSASNPEGAPLCEVAPIRPENAPEVRAQALYFLAIVEQAFPGNKRVWHKRLWVGRDGKQRSGMLQAYVDRGRRQLCRYGNVLARAGIMTRKRPPVTATTPEACKTRKGRAYNCYYFQFNPPRELTAALDRHKGRGQAADAGARQRAEAAPAPRSTPGSAELARGFLERVSDLDERAT